MKTDFITLLNVRFNRRLYKDVKWSDEYGHTRFRREAARMDEAEVVSSEIGNGMHAPVLDFDIPAALIPSSTPGHSHLYINHPMTWRQYKRVLKAMGKAGILEKGYVEASLMRMHSAVRVPWLKKTS